MPNIETLLRDHVTLNVDCAKSFVRIVRPVLHRIDPDLPVDSNDDLRRAWLACNRALDSAITEARIAA